MLRWSRHSIGLTTDSDSTLTTGFVFFMHPPESWWWWTWWSKPFTLSQLINRGCPPSPMLYVLAMEPFLRKLMVNSVLRGLKLPGSTISARFTTYANDFHVLVTSNAKMEEVSTEIRRYVDVMGPKINGEKSIDLRSGSWKGCALHSSFGWTDGPSGSVSISS